MGCDCEKYSHLELSERTITERIKETENIKQNLVEIGIGQNNCYRLWKCSSCNQFWQSNQWQWHTDREPYWEDYLYKVPEIEIEDWLVEKYLDPYDFVRALYKIKNFLKEGIFIERNQKCKKNDCDSNAIRYSIFCKIHHMKSLFIDSLKGRMYEPYKTEILKQFEIYAEKNP